MDICKYCGGEIEWRNINGQRTPIHVDGGRCDGAPPTSRFDKYTRDWWLIYGKPEYFFEDICKPTTCPNCHEPVYFIRHNGGSLWVDSLGWPWPKHPCFDHQNSITDKLEVQKELADLLFIGVVRSCRVFRHSSQRLLEIACLDGIKRFVLVSDWRAKQWIGEMVCIDTHTQVVQSDIGRVNVIDIGALTCRAITGYRHWGDRDYYARIRLDKAVYGWFQGNNCGSKTFAREELDWLETHGGLYQALLDGVIAPCEEYEREFIKYCANPSSDPVTEAQAIWNKLISLLENVDDWGESYLEWKLNKELKERKKFQGLVQDREENKAYLEEQDRYYANLNNEDLLTHWKKRHAMEDAEIKIMLGHMVSRGLLSPRSSI